MKAEQSSLFDDPPQNVPARVTQRGVDESSAPVSTPTSTAPTGQHSESDAADRRSYAGLADYIAGR